MDSDVVDEVDDDDEVIEEGVAAEVELEEVSEEEVEEVSEEVDEDDGVLELELELLELPELLVDAVGVDETEEVNKLVEEDELVIDELLDSNVDLEVVGVGIVADWLLSIDVLMAELVEGIELEADMLELVLVDMSEFATSSSSIAWHSVGGS